jgi:Raf kinase inhibitor-like YbhB/YbcL family protein
VPGTEIFYSIHGNILRPGNVVPNAVQAFIKTDGAITDRAMAAMEAADGSGGDSRCTCPPWPADGTRPKIPCDGKTAHVAYILMAERRDTSGDSHNNGTYAMYITVSQPAPDHAQGIKEGENLNPVKTLRMRYDAWRTRQPGSAFSTAAAAQTAAPARPQSAGGQRGTVPLPAPGRPPTAAQRGGGRPRGIEVMALSSSAWPDGGQIPAKHAQAGGEISPPLTWSHVPEGTASFVLIVHDADAATGDGTDDTLHWMLWNIPPASTGIPEGVPQGPQRPDGTRQIGATGPGYRGPGAAAAGPAHHYVFEIFALDTMVEVPPVGAAPAQTRAAVTAAMAGHVRGKAAYVGLYQRR